MVSVNDQDFQKLINQALNSLPGEHVQRISNVAILFKDRPTIEQRRQLKLDPEHTLLGLYEGIPLSKRQGMTSFLPDRITLFKGPLCERSDSIRELQENIRHTLWHEIAHYYGLNHDEIGQLE